MKILTKIAEPIASIIFKQMTTQFSSIGDIIGWCLFPCCLKLLHPILQYNAKKQDKETEMSEFC